LSDALAKGLLTDDFVTGARILALNLTNGAVQSYVWWVKGAQSETQRYDEDGLQIGKKPAGSYPWYVLKISVAGMLYWSYKVKSFLKNVNYKFYVSFGLVQ